MHPQHEQSASGVPIPLSCTINLVTRTAVSVVICFGPSRRPSKPFFLNSEVLSGIGQTIFLDATIK
jgi:hypothetical protein